jgi:hypothetical protein
MKYNTRGTITLAFDDKSLDELSNNLQRAKMAALAGGEQGMQHLLSLAYTRGYTSCPTFTGTLRSSMYQEQETVGDTIEGIVGHGGKYNKFNVYSKKFTDEYAIEVHEGHKIRREARRWGGTSKWLEKAINSLIDKYLQILQEYISASIMGRSTAELRASLNEIAQQLNETKRQARAAYFERLNKERKEKAAKDPEWQAMVKAAQKLPD